MKLRNLGDSFLDMVIANTPRLILRTWAIEDVKNGFEIWGDSSVMKYVDSGIALTLEQVKKTIEAGIRHQEKFGYQHWAVVEKASSKIIGACGFNSTEYVGEIELVFHFVPSIWDQGYATEAAKVCVEFAFDQIKPIKIIAGCHPENEASKKVLLKSGFSFVGSKWFDDTKREEPCFEMAR